LTIDESDIEAEVYAHDEGKDRFFIKVTFNGLGVYINSFAVLPSKFENQEYWVQPPAHRQGSIWKPTVEFDKTHYATWNIIEQKCLQAAKDFASEEARVGKPNKSAKPKDDDLINLDDIPF
jgi:hypothetical protein